MKSFVRDDRYFIMLDQSVFFPNEGGQNADNGVIAVLDDSMAGLDVLFKTGHGRFIPCECIKEVNKLSKIKLLNGEVIKEGNNQEIIYETESFINEGSRVLCLLDFDLRFMRMQNHSGEHVLTGVIHNKYGFNNVGFHLSDEGYVTLDLDGVLSYEQVLEMELEANRIIYENLPIIATYPAKEELESIEYRSKIDIDGQVRLITIGEGERIIDVCACCAPHVQTTAEIGIIKVVSVIKWKKGIQIAILCGERALRYLDNEHNIITNLARELSTSIEKVGNVVKSQMDEIYSLKATLSSLYEQQLIKEIESLRDDEPHLIITELDISTANMKNIYNALNLRFKRGYVGIFVGNYEQGYKYNAGIVGGDARELFKVLKSELSAKGGGSPMMIQGSLKAHKDNIKAVFAKEI